MLLGKRELAKYRSVWLFEKNGSAKKQVINIGNIMKTESKRKQLMVCLWLVLAGGSTSAIAEEANSPNANKGWEQGWEMFDNANELFVTANQKLANGRIMIREGEEKIASAGASLQLNRNSYVALVETGARSPESAESLARLQANIDRDIAAIIAGNEHVTKGHEMVSKGQQEIKQSRQAMQDGYGKAKKSKTVVNFRLTLPDSDGSLN